MKTHVVKYFKIVKTVKKMYKVLLYIDFPWVKLRTQDQNGWTVKIKTCGVWDYHMSFEFYLPSRNSHFAIAGCGMRNCQNIGNLFNPFRNPYPTKWGLWVVEAYNQIFKINYSPQSAFRKLRVTNCRLRDDQLAHTKTFPHLAFHKMWVAGYRIKTSKMLKFGILEYA